MTVVFGIPRQIFRPSDGAKFVDRGPGPIYSFYPDGRLLVIVEDKREEINRLHVVHGFAAVVKSRLRERR